MATPNPGKRADFIVRRQAFNFDTFQKDKLAKQIPAPVPVESLQDALARFNNDEKALLRVINTGLDESVKADAWSATDGWKVADKNMPTEKVYEGAIVSPGGVLTMVRTLAMTIFGMTPEMTKEEKKAKRQKALDFIKGNDGIREGLKNQAMASADDDDDDDND